MRNLKLMILGVALSILPGFFTLSASGSSPHRHHAARKEKHTFVYDLTGQDVRIYRVSRYGTLKIIYHEGLSIGQFPRCLIAAPNGRTLYIASDAHPNDYHSGRIYALPLLPNGIPKSTYLVDAGCMPLQMVINKSGRFLYCNSTLQPANKYVIFQYRIEPDGTLAALTPPLVNIACYLRSNPVGNYLYATTGSEPICFRTQKDGTLFRLPVPPTQAKVEDLAFSPKGNYVYLQNGSMISVAAVDPRTGGFSPPRPVMRVPSLSSGLCISPERNTLQIMGARMTSPKVMVAGPIFEFRLLPNGDLKPASPPSFPLEMTYLRRVPDGGFALVHVPQFK